MSQTSPQPAAPVLWSIADIERETGLGKDTLRVWERRYGFPQPLRDARGDRLYDPPQLERLMLLKRLLDARWCPCRWLSCKYCCRPARLRLAKRTRRRAG